MKLLFYGELSLAGSCLKIPQVPCQRRGALRYRQAIDQKSSRNANCTVRAPAPSTVCTELSLRRNRVSRHVGRTQVHVIENV
jgi:hypothetical protein